MIGLPYGFLAVRRSFSTTRQERVGGVAATLAGVVSSPHQPVRHVVYVHPVRRGDAQFVPVPRHDRLGAVVAGVLGACGAYLNRHDRTGAGDGLRHHSPATIAASEGWSSSSQTCLLAASIRSPSVASPFSGSPTSAPAWKMFGPLVLIVSWHHGQVISTPESGSSLKSRACSFTAKVVLAIVQSSVGLDGTDTSVVARAISAAWR